MQLTTVYKTYYLIAPTFNIWKSFSSERCLKKSDIIERRAGQQIDVNKFFCINQKDIFIVLEIHQLTSYSLLGFVSSNLIVSEGAYKSFTYNLQVENNRTTDQADMSQTSNE